MACPSLNFRMWAGLGSILVAALTSFAAASFVASSRARAQDQSDKLPSGESILDKYVEATGGADAYRKATNRKITGTMNIPSQGQTMKLTSYGAPPVRSYTLIESESFGQVEDGADGAVAWQIHPMLGGPRIKEGAERDQAMRDAMFNSELEWRSVYAKAECVGIENVGEVRCYKLQLTPHGENAGQEMAWYAVDTSLLVKRESTMETPMGRFPMTLRFDDYKTADGILFPHRMTVVQMNVEVVFTTDSVAHNVEIPAGRFDLPEGVRQLLAETKAKASGASSNTDGKPDEESPKDPK